MARMSPLDGFITTTAPRSSLFTNRGPFRCALGSMSRVVEVESGDRRGDEFPVPAPVAVSAELTRDASRARLTPAIPWS